MSLPYFCFYPSDFVMGTAAMNNAQVGTYTLLLCHQWDHGFVPEDPIESARIGRCSRSLAVKIVQAKFPVWFDGKRRNQRLERERDIALKAYTQKCEAGRSGAKKRWQRHESATGGAVVQPARRQCQSESEPESEPVKPERGVELPPDFPPTPEAAITACATIGCPEDFARSTWNKAASRGGHDAKDVPIRSWPFYLASEWTYERARHESHSSSPSHVAHSGAQTAQQIQDGKEYERILARIAELRKRFSNDERWTDQAREEHKKLKTRRDELKTILKIVI